MIVPDVNMLLYAELDSFPQHAAAKRWWEELLNGERTVGLAGVALFGFLRIATSRRVFKAPLSMRAALDRARAWLERPQVAFIVPGERHLEIAFGLLEVLGTGGNLTTDVQLAAHAIENGAEVHSNDVDFARFSGVRWVNPLSP